MIVLFTGHRNKRASQDDLETLAQNHKGKGNIWIHGGAKGFDSQVEAVAKKHGIITGVFKPAYNDKSVKSKAAPLKRNRAMANMADYVIVLWDGRETGGTVYTMRYAENRGMPVLRLHPQ